MPLCLCPPGAAAPARRAGRLPSHAGHPAHAGPPRHPASPGWPGRLARSRSPGAVFASRGIGAAWCSTCRAGPRARPPPSRIWTVGECPGQYPDQDCRFCNPLSGRDCSAAADPPLRVRLLIRGVLGGVSSDVRPWSGHNRPGERSANRAGRCKSAPVRPPRDLHVRHGRGGGTASGSPALPAGRRGRCGTGSRAAGPARSGEPASQWLHTPENRAQLAFVAHH